MKMWLLQIALQIALVKNILLMYVLNQLVLKTINAQNCFELYTVLRVIFHKCYNMYILP